MLFTTPFPLTTTMKSSFSILSLLSAVVSVSAHGYLAAFQVNNGDVFKSPTPGSNSPNNSPIRSVSSPDPNYLTSNPAITCGPNSQAGTVIANVNPGDSMSFDWEGADGSNVCVHFMTRLHHILKIFHSSFSLLIHSGLTTPVP